MQWTKLQKVLTDFTTATEVVVLKAKHWWPILQLKTPLLKILMTAAMLVQPLHWRKFRSVSALGRWRSSRQQTLLFEDSRRSLAVLPNDPCFHVSLQNTSLQQHRKKSLALSLVAFDNKSRQEGLESRQT